jgi:hypothetical protein
MQKNGGFPDMPVFSLPHIQHSDTCTSRYKNLMEEVKKAKK